MHLMIDQKSMSGLKTWFDNYVRTFRSDDRRYQMNIDLKEMHTRRVCAEIVEIGKSLSLSREELHLSEVIALFHDVGRFEQYAQYKTFSDLHSENHAILGIKVLKEEGVLEKIDPSTRELILRSISYHNRAELPDDEIGETLFYTKLLRDADKLDIWRVVTDYYHRDDGARNESIELGLPDSPEISSEAYADLLAGRTIKMKRLKTLNDFKLLQMSWIYDVNFPRTFQLVRERGYLEMLRDALPQTDMVFTMYASVKSYLEENCCIYS